MNLDTSFNISHPFPRIVKDLYSVPTKLLTKDKELKADHPGFNDLKYCARREKIANYARTYKYGDPIARVDYTKEEIRTWRAVFKGLTKRFPTHACREFNEAFKELSSHCHYREENIPQLEDVSNYLRGQTGFVLRPVGGLVSFRDFLAGLAFRVFHATQYVRHPSVPTYSPEPDVCHELLGHAAMFANPGFADLAQEIGLASLGASEESIDRLSACYWFTIEVGLCRQDGALKAYGGALLSSIGELEYCVSGKPEVRLFDPFRMAIQAFPLTEYQPIYYAAETLEDAKERMKKYSESLVKSPGRHDFCEWSPKDENLADERH